MKSDKNCVMSTPVSIESNNPSSNKNPMYIFIEYQVNSQTVENANHLKTLRAIQKLLKYHQSNQLKLTI